MMWVLTAGLLVWALLMVSPVKEVAGAWLFFLIWVLAFPHGLSINYMESFYMFTL